ncbi:glycolipid 2-alpha-mannosyltransferase [Pseudomassariella vexata]|uniref:Glycolipid 2-alpha-mannosyltransferase n=1 Tax=Pseudomassariella vexata TaxID=1141098 RepID=A0A1Y2E3A8_9PEZI|nr:glycolipid 2-alpha-mannosyltransferase [Pseudomassariella vexata]ORY65989.1 glycolipid 2-alpha-mannosyltransferase [Pseudomassariella vexata]
MLRRVLRPARRLPLWIVLPIAAALLLEVLIHRYHYQVPAPDHDLDPPFFTSCQEPDVGAPRENAVLVMMARNSELEKANKTITSIEKAFNRWFKYPIVFMNDEAWDPKFIKVLNQTSGGKATFEVIPQPQWTFPEWMDDKAAKQSIKDQGRRGIPHADSEGYHHMCRFYSGQFYQLEALKKYRWYWRLEPDVDFSCAITYDPFVQMAKHNKVYGFTIALWEIGTTCPTLFRDMADWMEVHRITQNNLWKAMVQASWVPYPFRKFLSFMAHRDRHGDEWSMCHYWSNFEIADMNFFRTREYMDLFEYLDRKGGFYFERWGDAAVHALAVAMLVDPRKVHHFEDLGYRHDQLYQCPANAPGGQLLGSKALGDGTWAPEIEGGIGCRCECDGRKTRNHPGYCLNKLKQPNSPKRPWLTWFM